MNKVCALLSEGAEECAEARRHINAQSGTVQEQRCTSALNWYQKHVEDVKRRSVCGLLADVKCRAYGEEATSCVNARADVAHLSKTLSLACRAELLLFKAFP